MGDCEKKNIIVSKEIFGDDESALVKTDQASVSDLLGEVNRLWIAGNIASAVERFREKGAHADLERLYQAYLRFRDEILIHGEEYVQQLNLFNSVFLNIIEERGGTESDLYVSVLKDSQEYRFFNDHVKNGGALQNRDHVKIIESPDVLVKPQKRLTLKDILYSKDGSLQNCGIELWRSLLHEYFDEVNDENIFVAETGKIINKVKSLKAGEPFYLELLIVYSIQRLSLFKSLSVESKDYAMKLVNMMRGRGNIWQKLHREYLVIIRKPSPSDAKRRVR